MEADILPSASCKHGRNRLLSYRNACGVLCKRYRVTGHPKRGKPLRTENEQQCFECGADWHDRARQSDEDQTKAMLSPEARALWYEYASSSPSAVSRYLRATWNLASDHPILSRPPPL